MEGDWMRDADEQHQKDYYKILEIDYDATDEDIRLSYRRLALKWHPDKHVGSDDATAKFQEINEAYRVLSDPDKRIDYDLWGIYEIDKYTLREYLTRFKGMILTSNGLGISHASAWKQNMLKIDQISKRKEITKDTMAKLTPVVAFDLDTLFHIHDV